MGILEFEMERNWQGAVRYAAYETKLPEGGSVYLQILDKAIGKIYLKKCRKRGKK